jgi:hypothetical protein
VFESVPGRPLVVILVAVVVGLVGTTPLSGSMSKSLFGVSATDPQTLVIISLILIGVAFAAAYLPARRAKSGPAGGVAVRMK